jgi:hypothetical protein
MIFARMPFLIASFDGRKGIQAKRLSVVPDLAP